MPDMGNTLLSAVKALYPRYSRTGDLTLPRFSRALQGWNKLMPGQSRWPIPWPMVAAAAVWLAKRNYMAEALGMIMQFSAYLRPGELSILRVMDLVPPPHKYTKGKTHWSLLVKAEEVGVPTKTNTFDDSVILDSPYTEGFDKWWMALADMRHKGRGAQFERLLAFEQTHYVRMVKTALEAVGGGVLGGVVYSMRPGGPAARPGTGTTSSGP